MSGRRVGRYVVGPPLGAGGMGLVTLGRLDGPFGFERVVALKRLHPHLAADADALTMAVDEARLGGLVAHPGLVPVVDLVREDGEVVLVSEYVHGPSLAALASARRARRIDLSLEAVACIGLALLDALGALHAARDARGRALSVVHRDVSPHNVLVSVDGVVRLSDFGVATHALKRHATLEGQVKGKFGYMAPEQLEARAADARADLFAVGVLVWELLAGARLFGGEGPRPTRVAAPSAAGAASDTLDAVVLRALASRAEDRYPTTAAMAVALRAALGERAPLAPRDLARELADDLAAFDVERRALLDDLAARAAPSDDPTAPTQPMRGRGAAAPSSPRVVSPGGRPRGAAWVAVATVLASVAGLAAWAPSRGAAERGTFPRAEAAPVVGSPPQASATSSRSASAPSVARPAEEHALGALSPPPAPRAPAPDAAPLPARAPAAKAAPSASGGAPTRTCDPPFVVDGEGLKRFRPECL